LLRTSIGCLLMAWVATAHAEGVAGFDAPAAFGARPSVITMSLSPDGTSIAFIAPGPGQSVELFKVRLGGPNPTAVGALRSDGKRRSEAPLHASSAASAERAGAAE